MRGRWFAPLLERPVGTTLFVRKEFPDAVFSVEKQVVKPHKITRHISFKLDGKRIVRALAEVDPAKTKPAILDLLREGKLPIGEIVKKYNVSRTRLRSTTRTREFHFVGDMHARIWERFYVISPTPKAK